MLPTSIKTVYQVASWLRTILTAVMTNIVVDKNTVHAKRNVDLSNHRVSGAALFLVWSRFILINLIISLWRESKILQFASFFLNWINMQFLIVKQLNRNRWPLTPIDEPGNHKKLKKKTSKCFLWFQINVFRTKNGMCKEEPRRPKLPAANLLYLQCMKICSIALSNLFSRP